MRSMRLILNGKGAASLEVREAVQKLRQEGFSLEVRVTWESGDAARYAQEAQNDGIEVLIAGGGDGTLNEVVNGLMNTDSYPAAALAVLPLGTANDFATGCNIPIAPYDALKLASEGSPVLIDVGKANDRYFINAASGGFGAEVTANTPPEMKRVLGGGAYSLVGLMTAVKMRPYQGKLIGPEGEEQASAIFMAVGNGRQTGGGYQVAPHAFIDDGLLDVLVIKDFPFSDLGILLNELLNLGAPDNKYVVYRQMSRFDIVGDEEGPLNLDGEPTRIKNIRFGVMHRSLPFILPKGSDILTYARND